MSKNEARRQKQLAKKKAKRDEKRTQLARQTSSDPTVRLSTAGSWPIVDTSVPTRLWSSGLGQLVIARRQPDGRLACGVFLVDVYCLGVKSAFWRVFSNSAYQELLRDTARTGGPLERVAPEYFAKLLRDAVNYAHGLGFAPDPDYRQAKSLLSGIDPALCTDTFEFGRDGKPLYIGGPNDSRATARFVAKAISDVGGNVILPVEAFEGNVRVLSDSGRENDLEEAL